MRTPLRSRTVIEESRNRTDLGAGSAGADAVAGALEASGDGDAAAVAGWFAGDATANPLSATAEQSGFVAPSDFRVAGVVKDGYHDADVSVSYRVSDAAENEVVAVTRDGWLAPWRIDAAPPVLRVDTKWPVPVRVAGVSEESGPVTVSPGAYKVAVDHDLFTPAAETAVVGLGGGDVRLELKLRDDATDTTSQVIKEVIDACAASAEPLTVQSQCPFFDTRIHVVQPDEESWTVTDYPDIKLEPADGEFTVATTSNGMSQPSRFDIGLPDQAISDPVTSSEPSTLNRHSYVTAPARIRGPFSCPDQGTIKD